MIDPELREKLLEEPSVKLEDAMKMASRRETASLQAKTMAQETGAAPVHKLSQKTQSKAHHFKKTSWQNEQQTVQSSSTGGKSYTKATKSSHSVGSRVGRRTAAMHVTRVVVMGTTVETGGVPHVDNVATTAARLVIL